MARVLGGLAVRHQVTWRTPEHDDTKDWIPLNPLVSAGQCSVTLVQNKTVLKRWRDVEVVELRVISASFSDEILIKWIYMNKLTLSSRKYILITFRFFCLGTYGTASDWGYRRGRLGGIKMKINMASNMRWFNQTLSCTNALVKTSVIFFPVLKYSNWMKSDFGFKPQPFFNHCRTSHTFTTNKTKNGCFFWVWILTAVCKMMELHTGSDVMFVSWNNLTCS